MNSRIETEQTSFEKSNAEKLQEIANNNAEITSLNKTIAQQTQAVKQMDEVVAGKDAEIEAKVAQLTSKDAEIASLEESIQQNEEAAAQKAEEALAKEEVIAGKDAEILKMGDDIATRDAEVESMTVAIALMEDQIAELKAAQMCPMKQLEMFITSKDEKIFKLEADLGTNNNESHDDVEKPTLLAISDNLEVDPAAAKEEDLTSNETISTSCDATKEIIQECNIDEEHTTEEEEPVFEYARDDAPASARIVEIAE